MRAAALGGAEEVVGAVRQKTKKLLAAKLGPDVSDIGAMAGSLFLRAIERGDRIYLAMASRGYDGEIRSFPMPDIPRAQWLVLLGALIILALLLGLSILF